MQVLYTPARACTASIVGKDVKKSPDVESGEVASSCIGA